MISNDEIKEEIESAFSPLRCVAEIWDYGQKLRFKVFDGSDEGVIEMPSIGIGDISDESDLRRLLESARERVEQKGNKLDPWP